jgi:hypothetical protein
MMTRISDGAARALAAVAAFAIFALTVAVIGLTDSLWGTLGHGSIVWAPPILAAVAWIVVYERKTRLIRCPSGCRHRVDVWAAHCMHCGRQIIR